MKTKIFLVILLLELMSPLGQISAKELTVVSDTNLPEQEGLYNVSGHQGLKLRVFVYHVKNNHPGKPTPVAPQVVCQATSLADPDSTAVIPGAGWKLPTTTWIYNLNPNSVPPTVGSTNLETITANAFNVWVTQAKGQATVQRGPNTTIVKATRDGKNIITWGRTSDSALAVSYIWYQNGIAQEIDTIFNKSFTWYWSNPADWSSGNTCAYSGVYDAQNILTHELGHTFGLDDTYDAPYINNTMYGYGSKSETKKNTLTSGDIAGLWGIY